MNNKICKDEIDLVSDEILYFVKCKSKKESQKAIHKLECEISNYKELNLKFASAISLALGFTCGIIPAMSVVVNKLLVSSEFMIGTILAIMGVSLSPLAYALLKNKSLDKKELYIKQAYGKIFNEEYNDDLVYEKK